MKRLLPLIASIVLLPAAARAQAPIVYEISFPNRAHHEAEVVVTFPELEPGALHVFMSRSSPGRYALHEFAKNIYNFRATDAEGHPLKVRRPGLHEWIVAGHGGEAHIAYTLYGDRADGTYTGIDRSHGHLNMPATFVWAQGYEARRMELVVHVPEGSGWKVATQLAPTDDPARFRARDLAYFMDSPTEVSDFELRTWQVPGPHGSQTMRLVIHHGGTPAEVDEYARRIARVVRTEAGIFGELPAFDHGTYTFLACYLPWVAGDGMEHRNSTVLTSQASLATGMDRLLGTVAHEFFHAWNMERIRSAELEPFDLERTNMSDELWFGEGFTSYYDDLALWRSGLLDDEAFARALGRAVGFVLTAPGSKYFSPVGMSRQAPFVDAVVSVDPTNRANTFISYYTWGSALGLALDLTLRGRPGGVTLDDLMREMWVRHGRIERPYTLMDIQGALARVTGDAGFAEDFFRRYVRGRDLPDFRTLLAQDGFVLERAHPGAAWLGGVVLRPVEGTLEVAGATLVGSPLHRAGLDRGDRVLALDGRVVASRGVLAAWLKGHRPGDRVRIRYRSRGQERTEVLELEEDPSLRVVPVEAASGRLESAQRSARDAWRRGPEGPEGGA